jgi:hypothetical protein
MKKPMKFKRYDEGGEIEEAKAKERGLEISNRDDPKPSGFLEGLKRTARRFTEGNIDTPGSEAYNKYGAGRGRAERNPVSESVSVNEPMAVARPTAQPNPIFEEGRKQGMRQPSGDASVAEEYAGPRTKPIVTASVSKPSASKTESKIESKPKTPAYVQRYTEEMMEADNPRNVKAEKAPAVKQKPAAEAPSAPKTSSSRVPTSEQAAANRSAAIEKVKGMGSSIADYFSTYETPAERRNKEKKAARGYASGGSVSSASRRADGIATKGKTRGKMC